MDNTNYNDEKFNDDTRTIDGKEPATGHDVKEGGLLGAIGGGVVGAVAGGPIGAVIGAVVGGAASAGAVDVVDKHDDDYAETIAKHPDTKSDYATGTATPVGINNEYTATTPPFARTTDSYVDNDRIAADDMTEDDVTTDEVVRPVNRF